MGGRDVRCHGRAGGGGRLVRRLVLGPGPAVAASRDFTLLALTDWGAWPTAERRNAERTGPLSDALLSVSELVTNACLHGGGAWLLELRWTPPDTLRIEVFDHSPVLPAPHTARPPGQPGGYGLPVIDLLCDRWGVTVRREVPGKSVWAELAGSDDSVADGNGPRHPGDRP
ncbi:ATP-binding protein [Streptacidiphilus sp. MAP12-20]|uniref:ATP-binding protein n=1 Tax=Streptacidiphilus sp. MAP12-20 TaxID=3156299 RepID=UPI00351474A5